MERMSLDEAIARAREVANENSACCAYCSNISKTCEQCEQDHEQLAQWLEELKALRHEANECRKAGYSHGYSDGYNKAIDDFLEKIQWEYLEGCGIKQSEIEFLVAVSSNVAEQLKAGK